MTQYADTTTNEGYYNEMQEQLKILDSEALQELMDLVPEVNDRFNKILYDLLFNIDNAQLQELITMWQYLSIDDIENALNVINVDVMELFDGDDTLFDYQTLEDIADEDLRANGINANALYWIKDLELNNGYNYYRFNGYANGFYYYDDLNDAIDEVIGFTVIENKLKDYFY
jgi:hypothetical protein